MGAPLTRGAAAALCLAAALASAPAAAETWSTRDVEAAERYRAEERERAERYRAALERSTRELPEASRKRTAAGGASLPRDGGLVERLSDWLGDRLTAWLEELVAAAETWLAQQLAALAQVFEEPPPRHELREVERPRGASLDDWLARERARARSLLEGRAARSVPRPDPAAERAWAERERERAPEWEREWQETERERADPAPWEERWREAESWERIERERALRQLDRAREWQREEEERLRGRGDG